MLNARRVFSSILSLIACVVGDALAAEAPTDGLVAYYSFDGHANDASGNQLHGLATLTIASSNRFGAANSALFFDGVESAVNFGNPAQFNIAGSFTIAVWVKLNGPQINTYILGKYDFPNSAHNYGLGTATGSQAYGFVSGEAPGYQDVAGTASLNDSNWHALVLVYESGVSLRLFVDGKLAGSVATPQHPAFANNVPLMAGRIASGQPFSGSIDDLRIYNRALTIAEIVTLGPPPDLQITQQPGSYKAAINASVGFRVNAVAINSPEPLEYQWFQGDEAIPRATNNTLNVSSPIARDLAFRLRIRLGSLEKFSSDGTVSFIQAPEAKLLAHYTFEDDTDQVVFDATGSFPGQPFNIEHIPGRIGKMAALFNGTNSYIRIPYPNSPLDLAASPYTIAWWMLWDTKTASQQVFWMGDGVDSFGGYGFSFATTQFSDVHNFGGSSGALWNGGYRPTNIWRHAAIVWNGVNRLFFTNGVQAANMPTSAAIISEGDDDLYLGARNGTNLFLRGALDDVRFYTYALATDEIAQLSAAPLDLNLLISVSANELVLTWPFVDSNTIHRVEYTTALGANAEWFPAAGAPQQRATGYTLNQPIPGSARFYRLRKL